MIVFFSFYCIKNTPLITAVLPPLLVNTVLKFVLKTLNVFVFGATQIPVIMIASFCGGAVINNTDDYTIASKTVTPNPDSLIFEIGTKIKFTYTF